MNEEFLMNEEFFQNGVRYTQGRFRLTTDAMLLADFAAPRPGAAICDLCAGAGAVGFLLLAKEPDCRVTALELQAEACALAERTAAENGLTDRLRVLCGDLREPAVTAAAGRFDCVVCNPPYYPAASGKVSGDAALAAARTELYCTLEDVCAAAARLLKTGGAFFLVHKPERLTDVLCGLRAHRLEPKLLRLVRHTAEKAPSLVLVKAAAGGSPGLKYLPELILHEADGSQTAEYRRVYHLEESK